MRRGEEKKREKLKVIQFSKLEMYFHLRFLKSSVMEMFGGVRAGLDGGVAHQQNV